MTTASAPLSEPDLTAVAERMRQEGEMVGDLRAELISGGRSNLTVLLSDDASSWVMRMPPRAGRTPSAHDVIREFTVVQALAPTDVPVARAVVACADEDLIGSPFAITEFVDGSAIRTEEQLAGIPSENLGTVVADLVEALSRLHRVDHGAVGLAQFGRPGGYAARQLRRWASQWDLVSDESRPDLATLATRLIGGLEDAVPADGSVTIVHGDYRLDNALVRVDATPGRTVAAIVDWELSTLGDPVADVAMMSAYRHPAFDHIMGFASAWASPRLPSGEELAHMYAASGGVPLENWDFHLALAYFKIAAISAGIAHRHRVGATSGPGFDSASDAIEPFLREGLHTLGEDC